MKISFERILIIFFLITIVGVVALGIVNFRANRSYFESTEWVEHTSDVIVQSTKLLSTLQDMGVRGYITTGDSSLLEPYNNAASTFMLRFDSLQAQTRDNKAQLNRIYALKNLAIERAFISKKYIDLFDSNKIDPPAIKAFGKESKANMDKIRSSIADIVSEEQQLLNLRKKANEQSRHNFNTSVALIFSEIALLLIVTFISFVLYLYRRNKYEEKILKLNTELAGKVTELNNANKELESFSYSVSHDLRAPLRIIDGFAKIMAEEYKDNLGNEANRFINAIRANAKQMGQLIDDLLNFSRLNRLGLSIHNTDMHKLVDEVINSFTLLNLTGKVSFNIGNIAHAQCDESLMRQVWTNLISNALKYSRNEEKPVITISSTITDAEIIYSIIDNGVGFDMEFADKLFMVFQRLHRVSEYEGTGVGLALVNRIINRHSGRVWAQSEPGKGAAFYFSLPKNT